MASNPVNLTIKGVILDEQSDITLDDMCRACRVEQGAVIALIEEGIVEPRVRSESPWRFSGTSLPRVSRALRLQRDFELNPAGVAIALDLLNEIEDLRRRLKIREIHEDPLHD